MKLLGTSFGVVSTASWTIAISMTLPASGLWSGLYAGKTPKVQPSLGYSYD